MVYPAPRGQAALPHPAALAQTLGITFTIMRAHLITLLLAALLTACDSEAVFQKLIPQEEAAEGQKVIALVTARDFESLEQRLDISIRTPDARDKFSQIADTIPKGQPKSVSTIGARVFHGETDTRYDLTYEYEYENTWMIANVVFQRKAGTLFIQGVHVAPTPKSQKELNALNLSEKGLLHFAFLALAVVIPLFIVTTLIVCYRTVVAERKWLWYLFIAIGLIQFSLNWSTGTWNIQPVSFLLLGAGFTQSGPYGPLILTIAFPVGAVVFLARRKSLAMRGDA